MASDVVHRCLDNVPLDHAYFIFDTKQHKFIPAFVLPVQAGEGRSLMHNCQSSSAHHSLNYNLQMCSLTMHNIAQVHATKGGYVSLYGGQQCQLAHVTRSLLWKMIPTSKVYDMTMLCKAFNLMRCSELASSSSLLSGSPGSGSPACLSSPLGACKTFIFLWKALCRTHSKLNARSAAAVAIVIAQGYSLDSPRQGSVRMGYASPRTCTNLQHKLKACEQAVEEALLTPLYRPYTKQPGL